MLQSYREDIQNYTSYLCFLQNYLEGHEMAARRNSSDEFTVLLNPHFKFFRFFKK